MTIDGVSMRIVATQVHLPGSTDVVRLVVGETVNKRATLLSEILLEMALPQLACCSARCCSCASPSTAGSSR